MKDWNHIFFEKYKKLDKLCQELYGTPHGVSSYIEDMKAVPEENYRHIPDWEEDREQLIRLRHIRNQLAHTPGALEEEICTEDDIRWLRDFHKRILQQSDPVAMLYSLSKGKRKKSPPPAEDKKDKPALPLMEKNKIDPPGSQPARTIEAQSSVKKKNRSNKGLYAVVIMTVLLDLLIVSGILLAIYIK